MKIIHIRPPLIALLYLFFALGLHYLSPGKTLLHFPYPFLGTMSLGVGFTVMIWAWGLFRRKGTAICPTGHPTPLVTAGPFRLSRNPMYLGITLMLLGIAFLVGTLPVFLAPLAFFLTMDNIFIPHEEKTLGRIFGQEYLDYTHRVRRWL